MATPIPQNQAVFSAAEVAQATGGILRPSAGTLGIHGVSTDSRADLTGKLFVALRGETFDGHRFLPQAVAAGAAGLLVSDTTPPAESHFTVQVSDTLEALGALGAWHRRRWGQPLVAVGGSAGKTTTRAAISALFQAIAPEAAHFERGNLNNRIGVPMVLLGLERRHRVGILEIGTNAVGEVGLLAQVAQPNIAVLTLVALEHSEGLGDLDAIEDEEGTLLRHLPPNGVAVANADDPRALRQLSRSSAQNRVTYGTQAGADYQVLSRCPLPASGLPAVGLEGGRSRVRLSARGRLLDLECSLLGEPGALAAAAAVAVAEAWQGHPIAEEQIHSALAAPTIGEPGRLVPITLANGTLVLDDTYNANPASVHSSVRVAREIASQRQSRLLLVLGEMRELGACSVEEHAALGRALAGAEAAQVIAIGGHARFLAQEAERAGTPSQFVENTEEALDTLLSECRPGDVILIKASRGVRAERVVLGLTSRLGVSP